MIDLNKKYTTVGGFEVVLFDKVDNTVFGRYYHPELHRWTANQWSVSTGKCQFTTIDDNFDLVEVEVPSFEITNLKCKRITYFGNPLIVHEWANWICTDKSGTVWIYSDKPNTTGEVFDGEERTAHILDIEYLGNWKDSLVEIK